MRKTFRIHPAIGIARLGNSPTSFYLCPETPAGLPQECDDDGNPSTGPDGMTPVLVEQFKDAQGRVRRQAARFQVFVYDEESPEGRPLRIGDPVEGGGNSGTLVDIQWRVHLANKKASSYEFQQLEGEHGHLSGHPRRNAHITGSARQRLVIDPGPRLVNGTDRRRTAFDRSGDGVMATRFPPENLAPHGIDTLGDLLVDNAARLLVLGGHGRSGSELIGPGNPSLQDYANNDGWYDDTSDGPVMARLVMYSQEVGRQRFVDVEYPAWVIVGYPRFVPEILDIVTLEDVMEDMFLREMALDTGIFGKIDSFAEPQQIDSADPEALRFWHTQRLEWNRELRPWFWRDIWPILFRPNEFNYLTNVLAQSNYPHSQSTRGTFDPGLLCVPPRIVDEGCEEAPDAAVAAHLGRFAELPPAKWLPAPPAGKCWSDPNYALRQFLFQLLRLPGEENAFRETGKITSRLHHLPLMPLLAGDNPISNDLPSKFLRLTDYQLFILRQWADGRFIDEYADGLSERPADFNPWAPPYPIEPPTTGRELDRWVLANVLGGAFCPGGEVGWVMRNPSIYREPWRLKVDLRFSAFGMTAAQASSVSGNIPPEAYVSYLEFELDEANDFDRGLQPGDLTKNMALPWQSDFNECSTQSIDVTYEGWNKINPENDNDSRLQREQEVWETLWWPAHRPMQTYVLADGAVSVQTLAWAAGIPQSLNGNLKMVSDWWQLGFVVRNPTVSVSDLDSGDPPESKYVTVQASNHSSRS